MTVSESVLDPTARWRFVIAGCVLVFLALLALFWPTAEGMAYIWYNFETYTHGFIILPISLWLIWQKRQHLAAYTPQPAAVFLIFVAGGLFVWALARLTGVLVVEQAAFVGVLVATLVSLLGWQVSKFLAFPLLFLFFAVPMGEDLVPPMMEFTATFTVEALKLTGIPVYRDGLWFSLPSGDWSVVEACSGVRYLIASVTLGVMYAYITYHTLWKRLLFIALSAVVPILANGLRAYMIVMIGHLSDMEYATGVDHLIYGWVFFGIVMFILFWVGSFWHEEQDPPETVVPARNLAQTKVNTSVVLIAMTAIALSAAGIWATERAENVESVLVAELSSPVAAGTWKQTSDTPLWQNAHQTTTSRIAVRYRQADNDVQLFVVLFPHQHQGAEAISPDNKVAQDLVRSVGLGAKAVDLGGATPVVVNRSRSIVRIDGREQSHLVWQWYRVAGRSLTNRYEGKAWEAISRIYPGRADGAWIAITTPIDDDIDAAGKRLADFAASIAPEVDKAIDRSLGLN